MNLTKIHSTSPPKSAPPGGEIWGPPQLKPRNCIWQLVEEETTEEQVRKAVPDYLWQTADFVLHAGSWIGTSTELPTAAQCGCIAWTQSSAAPIL